MQASVTAQCAEPKFTDFGLGLVGGFLCGKSDHTVNIQILVPCKGSPLKEPDKAWPAHNGTSLNRLYMYQRKRGLGHCRHAYSLGGVGLH